MKKLFFIALIIAFAGVASAQDKTITASDMLEKQNNSEMNVSIDVQSQTKKLLITDEELGEEAIRFLKSDSKSADSLKKIYRDSNGNVSHIMNAVMNDAKLSKIVMDWVTTDPKAIQYVQKLIGM